MTTPDERPPFRLADEEVADFRALIDLYQRARVTTDALLAHVTDLCASYRDQGLVEGDLMHDGTIRAEVEAVECDHPGINHSEPGSYCWPCPKCGVCKFIGPGGVRMTAPDVTSLRALAEAAHRCMLDAGCQEPSHLWFHEGELIARFEEDAADFRPEIQFIAAANPTAVLALLDELEQLRAAYDDLEAARLETMDQRDEARARLARIEALAAKLDVRSRTFSFAKRDAYEDAAQELRAALETP